jgi:hypothetical protein
MCLYQGLSDEQAELQSRSFCSVEKYPGMHHLSKLHTLNPGLEKVT